jgi:hypothetical protein
LEDGQQDKMVEEVKTHLTHLLAEELLKTKMFDMIKFDSFDSLGYTYEASTIIVKPSEYKDIIDTIRKNNYNVVDKDGRIISLSELL